MLIRVALPDILESNALPGPRVNPDDVLAGSFANATGLGWGDHARRSSRLLEETETEAADERLPRIVPRSQEIRDTPPCTSRASRSARHRAIFGNLPAHSPGGVRVAEYACRHQRG
jgi:hypothetical protein